MALLAFAGNSLLCRQALGPLRMDPTDFTAIRLASGALLLLALAGARAWPAGHWRGALALLGYAALFSWAYVRLGAATGALLLFGAVQATMVGAGLWRGERLGAVQWTGVILAFGGLAWLLAPGPAPPPMAGVWCALASGALASGLGYAVWYTVVPRLSASAAATVQLAVPVVAALGGLAWLGETPDLRLVLAGGAVLAGIALVLRRRGA